MSDGAAEVVRDSGCPFREPRPRGSSSRTLAGTTIGFFVGFAAVSLFGPTAVLLQDQMGLTPLQLGLLVAAPSATGSLLRIPFGAWVETTGGRGPFIGLLAVSASGMLAILGLLVTHSEGLGAGHYPLLLGLGMLAGCGIAVFSVGAGQLSYWYPRRRQGGALAIYSGVGNLAPGVFTLLLSLLIGITGLATAYVLWTGILVMGTAAYIRLASPAPYFQFWRRGRGVPRKRALELARAAGQELFPDRGVCEALHVTARLPQTWALVALYFTSFGGFITLTAWLPTYWSGRFALGIAEAATLTMLYSVLASLCRIGGGFVADRAGGEGTAAAAFAVMAAGAVMTGRSASLATSIAGCLLMALGMGVANAAVFKLVPTYLATGGSGAGAGLVGGLGAFGGFLLPPILGMVVGRFGSEAGFGWSFGVFASLALLSMALTGVLVWRWQPRASANGACTVPLRSIQISVPEARNA